MRTPIELTDEMKALEKRPQPDIITQTRHYKLITPLFGGGIEAGMPDPITPIRGTEIRGQLRFWWRATQGGQFGKDGLKQMKVREDEIWGSAAKKEKKEGKKRLQTVTVQILEFNSGEFIHPFEVIKKPNDSSKKITIERHKEYVPAYAAFPLRPEQEDPVGTLSNPVRKDVDFVLKIVFAKAHQKDVKAALWAWETFGGIGARTRRGFGALQCSRMTENGINKNVSIPSNCEKLVVEQWLKKQLSNHAPAGTWPDNVPHIHRNIQLKVVKGSGDSWIWLIKKFHDFRQSRTDGSSDWPEANVVRQALTKNVSSKSPDIKDATPRAYFGLPIIFHIPQEGIHNVTLKSKNTERMASQLILRPLACNYNGGLALAALLDGPILPKDDLVLTNNDGLQHLVTADLDTNNAEKIKPLKGEKNVIQAFFNSLDHI